MRKAAVVVLVLLLMSVEQKQEINAENGLALIGVVFSHEAESETAQLRHYSKQVRF